MHMRKGGGRAAMERDDKPRRGLLRALSELRGGSDKHVEQRSTEISDLPDRDGGVTHPTVPQPSRYVIASEAIDEISKALSKSLSYPVDNPSYDKSWIYNGVADSVRSKAAASRVQLPAPGPVVTKGYDIHFATYRDNLAVSWWGHPEWSMVGEGGLSFKAEISRLQYQDQVKIDIVLDIMAVYLPLRSHDKINVFLNGRQIHHFGEAMWRQMMGLSYIIDDHTMALELRAGDALVGKRVVYGVNTDERPQDQLQRESNPVERFAAVVPAGKRLKRAPKHRSR